MCPLSLRYAGYANGVKDIVRKQLRHAKPGVATQDIAAAVAEKKKADAAAAAQLRQNRMVIGLGTLALLAVAAAKLYTWNKARKL